MSIDESIKLTEIRNCMRYLLDLPIDFVASDIHGRYWFFSLNNPLDRLIYNPSLMRHLSVLECAMWLLKFDKRIADWKNYET